MTSKRSNNFPHPPMKTQENEITEAQVVSFLQAKRAELQKAAGKTACMISLHAQLHDGSPQWCAYADGGGHMFSPTVGGAIAASSAQMSPASKAHRCRAEAERLLAEAERLETEAAK